MKLAQRAAILLMAFAFLAASTPAPVTKPLSGVAKEIANTRSAWIQALRAKQLDTFTKLYAPDAVFMQPTGERLAGQAALHALFKKTMDSVTSNPGLKSLFEEDSGDLAYDSGTYTEMLTPTSGAAPYQTAGSYLTIYRRLKTSTGNRWIIAQQVWTATPESLKH
ncbi:MAG TPA: nuclear transport factor 2 family protein [Candidatus Acidoferrales bacterium]|nr:nuclear transport factor 2 family protein [Candidatus Acidoferrales bacterium]